MNAFNICISLFEGMCVCVPTYMHLFDIKREGKRERKVVGRIIA